MAKRCRIELKICIWIPSFITLHLNYVWALQYCIWIVTFEIEIQLQKKICLLNTYLYTPSHSVLTIQVQVLKIRNLCFLSVLIYCDWNQGAWTMRAESNRTSSTNQQLLLWMNKCHYSCCPRSLNGQAGPSTQVYEHLGWSRGSEFDCSSPSSQ